MCGTVLLVVVTLPIIAIAAFLIRGVLLVAAIAGIAGCVALYCLSPRFRHWAGHRTAQIRPHRPV
jgi:hypothetical protein